MNKEKLASLIKEYKINFKNNIEEERYKWQALKHFQENWNSKANNFLEMYNNATKYERNLLTQNAPKLPKKMIKHFIEEGWGNEVKEAFSILYDENTDVCLRINNFIDIMNKINEERNKINGRTDISAHEDLNIASVYLWFKNPNKYYMYKPEVCKNISNALDYGYEVQNKRTPQANKYNFIETQKMYEEIRQEILKDNELQTLLNSCLNYEKEYNDKDYRVLTQDLGYFINKTEEKTKLIDNFKQLPWWQITSIYMYFTNKDKRYSEKEIITSKFIKQIMELKNTIYPPSIGTEMRELSNCTSTNYKRQKEYFIRYEDGELIEYSLNKEGIDIAKKLKSKYAKCIALLNDEKNKGVGNMTEDINLNQILYGPPGTGKTYNTIVEAMKIIGLPETKPNYITELDDEGYEKLQYKIKKYLNNYDDKEYKALKQAFDYYKSPEQGRIEFITFHQSYSYEEFVEGIKPDIDTCDWNEPVDKLTYKGTDGIFKVAANRALFDRLDIRIEQQGEILEFRSLKEKFIEEYGVGTTLKTNTKEAEFRIDKYTKNSARITPINGEYTYSITFKYLEEAYNKNMSSKNEIATINGVASGLAGYYYAIYEKLLKIKESDKSIEKTSNIKKMPEENKLQLVKDFYSGKINLNNLDSEPYVLIIDEINRGNISKIFGELITLIEEDKREKYSVTLPYSQEEFTVPKNLYIIGTMNTADRSIASVDIALRRRFTFKEMMPQPELIDENVICCNIDIKEMRRLLNKRICALLDRDHQIGHSYFLKLKNGANDKFKNIWFDNIMPLLNEYFYNDWEKLQAILGKAEGIDRNSFIEEIEINSDNFFAYETNPCDDNSYFDFRERSYFFDIEKGTERFVSAMRTAFASAYRE